MNIEINPKLDLVLQRIVDVPVSFVWKAWTEPEHIVKWFCPRPYEVYNCKVDLKPGGIFRTDMKGPDMPETPCAGCILEAVPNKKFVWTSALGPGYRPIHNPENPPDLLFTGMILLEALGEKTKYTAIARHGDEATSQKHAAMGFEDGWATCLDQLVEEIKKGAIT
ncbi:MAG: SRPBCC family protein [Halobacteriovoraceae bacterium]|nr:SRPBCC family protein [Halobacteriovoraceae bacterium]MCB9095342.1 SRPBCC family protein [Halobacteriovoraceae bacterium]